MSEKIDNLLHELEKMPGIGPKSAQRIAYWILNTDSANKLADTIKTVKSDVRFCKKCFNYATDDLCEICSNPSRNHKIICVVCEPRNIPPIERTCVFNGIYHVLGGEISPIDGVGPEDLNIAELMNRLVDVDEVVIATNPNVEGETTAAYLARMIKPLGIKITRPASGIPVGGDLEFADEVTLGRALEDRKEI
ncbi:MAG: recombination mediator RecR [Coriobacteriia bacterium]|nr:recombination mediator RecR [Coriobacteriia bacterium]